MANQPDPNISRVMQERIQRAYDDGVQKGIALGTSTTVEVVDLIELALVQMQRGLSDMPIESLGLSTRTYNVLTRESIRTVGQLHNTPKATLLGFRNFNEGCANDVAEQLSVFYKTQRPS